MAARLSLFLIVCSAALFISCDKNNSLDKSSKQDSAIAILANSFYKRFEGKAGRHKIFMNITRLDTTLMGNYQVDSLQPVPFSFDSKIDGNGQFTITAENLSNNNANLTGRTTFTGKFVSEKEIKGLWANSDKKGKDYFDLLETYPEGSAKFSTIYYHKIKQQKEPAKKGYAEITILYPEMINFTNDSVQKIINNYLSTKLLNNYSYSKSGAPYKNYDDMMNDFFRRYGSEIEFSKKLKMERDIYYSNFYEINVLYNSDNILSTRETVSTYEGGAHPLTNYYFKNFNLLSGKEIKLSDVLKENYMPELTNIAEIKFRESFKINANQNLKKAGFFFKNGKFNLNDNYSFTNYGITFQFNPYEVAAYVYGAPEIAIPYAEIKNLIKPAGVLGKFIK